MKIIFISIVFILSFLHVFSAEQVDSTQRTKMLKEVTVTAENSSYSPGKAIYFPLKEQKRSAMNGFDLLMRMGIPELDIMPGSNEVKTISGMDVSFFIDSQPANSNDVSALNTRNVKEIQFLTYPSDPRYGGKEYVVNFVMAKIEYGGYTRLYASDKFDAKDNNTTDGSVVSKMVYKAMTYDLLATYNNSLSTHFGSEDREKYNLPNNTSIIRDESVISSKRHSKDWQANFRAIYQTQSMSISNRVGFISSKVPYERFESEIIRNYLDLISLSSLKINAYQPYWSGNYYFSLPHNYMINVKADFSYMRELYNKNFSITDFDGFSYEIKEHSFNSQIDLNFTKLINKNQALTLDLNYLIRHSEDRYMGSLAEKSLFVLQDFNPYLAYTATFNKVYAMLRGGIMYEKNKINGYRQTVFNPYVSLILQYTPSNRNQLTFESRVFPSIPLGSLKSPAVIQNNESLWYTGNPDLKSYNHIYLSVNDVWRVNSIFALGSNIRYSVALNRVIPIYLPYDNPEHEGVIRTYENNGNFHDLQIGLSGNVRLLDNKLQISLSPRLMYTKSTGLYTLHRASFYMNASVYYYLKNFYFSASYSPEWKSLEMSGTQKYYKDYFNINAGWSNAQWNISLTLTNPFRDNWVNSTSNFVSQWYEEKSRNFSDNRHRGFKLEVSYTFNYGKKVGKRNELQEASSIDSTIVN